MKFDYEPEQKTGINRFIWQDESVLIVHPGAYLEQIEPGQLVMFRRHDNLVWCGRVWPDYYAFELEKPVDTWVALQWVAGIKRMQEANPEDFSGQEEFQF